MINIKTKSRHLLYTKPENYQLFGSFIFWGLQFQNPSLAQAAQTDTVWAQLLGNMGYGADVAEFAQEHGITDFDLACEMYNDPGGDLDDFAAGDSDEAGEPDGDSDGSHEVQPRRTPRRHVRQARRSRSRGRELCRSSGSGRSRAVPDQISAEPGSRMEKTLAVQRQCHLRGKTMEDFTAACDIVGFKDDPFAVGDSGQQVVQNVFERLDAEARRQNTSSDALLARKKAECAVQ